MPKKDINKKPAKKASTKPKSNKTAKKKQNKASVKQKIYWKISREFTILNSALPDFEFFDARKIPDSDIGEQDYYEITNMVNYLPDGTLYRVNAGEIGQTNIMVKGGFKGKIPYKYRLQIISQYIYPLFKDKSLREVHVGDIRNEIKKHLPNPVSERAKQEILVTKLRERIREVYDNPSPPPTFTGVVFQIPNTKSGKASSYFVDFILFDRESNPVPKDYNPDDIITDKVKMTKEEQTQRADRIKEAEILRKRLKPQKQKEDKEPKPKQPKKESKEELEKMRIVRNEQRNKALELLRKDYDDGLYSKEEYRQEREKIMNKYEFGGEV